MKMRRGFVQMWKTEDFMCRCEDGKTLCVDVKVIRLYLEVSKMRRCEYVRQTPTNRRPLRSDAQEKKGATIPT